MLSPMPAFQAKPTHQEVGTAERGLACHMKATTKKPRHPWHKTTSKESPHVTITHEEWTWRVLKVERFAGNEFDTVYCHVSSPYTTGEYGSVYVNHVPSLREVLKKEGV